MTTQQAQHAAERAIYALSELAIEYLALGGQGVIDIRISDCQEYLESMPPQTRWLERPKAVGSVCLLAATALAALLPEPGPILRPRGFTMSPQVLMWVSALLRRIHASSGLPQVDVSTIAPFQRQTEWRNLLAALLLGASAACDDALRLVVMPKPPEVQ